MSFLRSLFSGVSGLKNHQLMMDVIGNNISNINTLGFKASRATFNELFAQTLANASSPFGGNGGTNPMQIGLGMGTNAIDTFFSQGNIENTGFATDLAISGTGFFAVQSGGQTFYTRVGKFTKDANGNFVMPGGGMLLGKMADTAGNIPAGTQLEPIRVPVDLKSPAKATDVVEVSGTLDASAAQGATSSISVSVYDSLGNQHTLTLTFTKTANDNEWTWSGSLPAPAAPPTSGGSGTVSFNADGSLNAFTYDDGSSKLTFQPGGGAADVTIDLGFGTQGKFEGIIQSKGTSSLVPKNVTGYSSGFLTDAAIDQTGRIIGSFSNSTQLVIGQVMLVEFNNPAGLEKVGDNLYRSSGNSGTAAVVTPGLSTASKIVSGALESSNVDLAEEFTRMITAQRGFQSNARVITTSDEILNEVVNLKR